MPAKSVSPPSGDFLNFWNETYARDIMIIYAVFTLSLAVSAGRGTFSTPLCRPQSLGIDLILNFEGHSGVRIYK